MEAFLEVRRIRKSFGGVQALKGVSLSIRRGEGHCLVGENGSGKSTLIKIISGVLQPDEGEIWIEQERMPRLDPTVSIDRGIQVIYQDLSLFPNLTVAENIAFSELRAEKRRLVSWSRVRQIAQEAIERVGVELDLSERVGSLPVGLQQVVAICRALTREVKLLVLDEPTASLTKREITTLLDIVSELKARGVSILFVSHKLNEVIEVADRATVLRDGMTVGELHKDELTDERRIVSLMVGREIAGVRRSTRARAGEPLLEVRRLSRAGSFYDISFQLRPGEILGLAGLIGSGRSELAEALFGVHPADQGEILLRGKPVNIRSVQDAVRAGIAYVPENRLTQGLFLKHSVGSNLVAAVLERLVTRGRFLDVQRKETIAARWMESLSVKAAGLEAPARTLSGGNQQKLVLAKWLATEPSVLMLDGPTVGIDVGAKSAIHTLIHQCADQGMGILLISDELPELIANCDRILVMRAGRIHAEVVADEVRAEDLQALLEEGNGQPHGQDEIGEASHQVWQKPGIS